MSTYCYSKKNGEIVERTYKIGRAPRTIKVDGETAERDFQAENAGRPSKSGWPMVCVASGVNAIDAERLRKHFSEVGVPTEVTSDGDPVYTSAKHRSRALKSRGLFDKMAYS